MKDNNKHTHHDLIVEWAKDTSKQLQILAGDNTFFDCTIGTVIDNPKLPVRFKPREFIKGHWYPCVDEDGDKCVYFYDYDGVFRISSDECDTNIVCCNMKWIGKSLGAIKFGE